MPYQHILFAVVSLALTCLLGSPPQRPAWAAKYVPSAASRAAEADALAGLKTLTPDRLVEAVLANNPRLPVMESAWEAARDRIEPAGALDDPMLSFMAAPQTVGRSDVDFSYRVQLSQNLPWLGKRGLRRETASHEATAAQEEIQTTRLDLVAETKAAFADWYLVHAALRINAATQSLLREFRTIAEFLYAAARGKRQDVLQADVEYEMLENRRIALERERAEVRASLNRLLNRAPDAPLPPPDDLPEEPMPLPDVAGLRTTALESRSERRTLQARVEAERAKVELAQREFYPDFRLTTGYDRFWEVPEQRWSVEVEINLPLDRSKRRATASSARAQMLETQWRLEDLSAGILAAVEQAFARVEESRRVLALYRDRLLPLAEENLETAKIAYQAGTGDFLTLLTAERSLFLTRLNYEQTLADHYRYLAQLERVVGARDALQIEQPTGTRP